MPSTDDKICSNCRGNGNVQQFRRLKCNKCLGSKIDHDANSHCQRCGGLGAVMAKVTATCPRCIGQGVRADY